MGLFSDARHVRKATLRPGSQPLTAQHAADASVPLDQAQYSKLAQRTDATSSTAAGLDSAVQRERARIEPLHPTGTTIKALFYLFVAAFSFGIAQHNTPRMLKWGMRLAGMSSGFVVGSKWARRVLPERMAKSAQVLDALKTDRMRKLAVSVVVDLVILVLLSRTVPGLDVLGAEVLQEIDAAHFYILNVVYGPVINGVKLVTMMLPHELAAFVPMCVMGWLVENELLPMRRLNKLKGFRAGMLRRLVKLLVFGCL